MLGRILVGAPAAGMVSLVLATAVAAETVLAFSHYGSSEDTVHAAAERFKDLVEVGTNGEIQIDVHPGNGLGDASSVLQGVAEGTIDIGVVGNPYFTSLEPEMDVLDLPFLFENPSHAYKVLDGDIGRAILDKLERHGMKGLALWEIGFRNLTNSVRPIRTPEDVRGLKIRTGPVPAQRRAFELLGAEPVPGEPAELYAALESGAADGQENPAHAIYARRLHEVQGHLSMTRHAYTAAPLVMNLDTFNKLPEEHRDLIMEAAIDAAQYEREENDSNDESAVLLMKDEGMAVVADPDVAAFREAIGDQVRQDYVERHGSGVLDQIDELR